MQISAVVTISSLPILKFLSLTITSALPPFAAAFSVCSSMQLDPHLHRRHLGESGFSRGKIFHDTSLSRNAFNGWHFKWQLLNPGFLFRIAPETQPLTSASCADPSRCQMAKTGAGRPDFPEKSGGGAQFSAVHLQRI